MIKKKYVCPAVQAVTLSHTTSLMAGSVGLGISPSAADRDGIVLSRGVDFFDNEEF